MTIRVRWRVEPGSICATAAVAAATAARKAVAPIRPRIEFLTTASGMNAGTHDTPHGLARKRPAHSCDAPSRDRSEGYRCSADFGPLAAEKLGVELSLTLPQ